MTNRNEYRMSYLDPSGGITEFYVSGTDNEVNKKVDRICKRNNWNKDFVDIIAEREPGERKWCSR